MCLNTLLLVCLSSDRSIKESKAEIKFSPENGEIILLLPPTSPNSVESLY